MIIDTDEYVALADGVKKAGFSQSTGYRLAKKLGVIVDYFGVKIMKLSDIKTLQENRRRVGNQDWIASYETAASAARKAVASRMARKKKGPKSGSS